MSEENPAPANAIICGQCKTWYTGIATAHCGGCHLTFSRVSSFDKHRVGGKCKSPAVAGLVRNGRVMSAMRVACRVPSVFFLNGVFMSDSSVVGVLAEALAQHGVKARSGRHGVLVHCSCGVASEDHAAHVASVVAALPNIAVVSLPEGENRWHVTDWDGGRVSLCYGVDTVRCYLPNPALEVVEAEELGIALIAASRYLDAARAAGGQA